MRFQDGMKGVNPIRNVVAPDSTTKQGDGAYEVPEGLQVKRDWGSGEAITFQKWVGEVRPEGIRIRPHT